MLTDKNHGPNQEFRLKQVHVASIKLDNTQSIFYLDEQGRMLLLRGTREIDEQYERSHAGYFVHPVMMEGVSAQWLNRESMIALFQHDGLAVGWNIINDLGLVLQDAIWRIDQRREGLSQDLRYITEIFTRLELTTGRFPPRD